MARKIVIIPSFASYHFLKCWIPNMLDVINPDLIIINEGLFPQGPENKGHIDGNFKEKWCHPANESFGFDFPVDNEGNLIDDGDELKDILAIHSSFIPAGGSLKILWKPITYIPDDVNTCFLEAISTFHGYEPEVGDIIFPLEPDAFVFDGDKDIIQEEILKLKPGEGISCKWVDFLETQFYTEAINISQPKYRRFAYCFDNMENYLNAVNGFMTQDYTKLKKVNSFFVRHYAWFQPEPYKQLRYDLIYRSNPQYWKDFDKGLQEIRNMTEMYVDHLRPDKEGFVKMNLIIPLDKILLRPSRTDEGRWAKFIDCDHPKTIKNHPNFVK